MIDDNKLLGAFVLGAYEIGQCGVELSLRERRENIKGLKDFVEKGGNEFPWGLIDTQTSLVRNARKSIRRYIYNGHFEALMGSSAAEELAFDEAVQTREGYGAALLCAVNPYIVEKVDKNNLYAKNLVNSVERKLFVLPGLENPKVGDVVSGHWNHFLEVHDPESHEFKEYMGETRGFYNLLKRLHETQK